ncbi:hypothetical protein M0R72_17390 [Candidatus Pacearchaeota archaeon]|jgi:hypothetical protein|nr:hypothetical protein [Candidatus Pacearchaeota archaeon]
MIIKSGGSGFFYTPFTLCQSLGEYMPVSGGINAYGAWNHAPLGSAGPTIYGRWIVLRLLSLAGNVFSNGFQIGIGPVGMESILYPSSGGSHQDFKCDALPAEAFKVEQIYSFPCFIQAGSTLSVRAKSGVAGSQFRANIELYG